MKCCHKKVAHSEYEPKEDLNPSLASPKDKQEHRADNNFVFREELYTSDLVDRVRPKVVFTIALATTLFLIIVTVSLYPFPSTLVRVGMVLNFFALILFYFYGSYFMKGNPFSMSTATISNLLCASVVTTTMGGCFFFSGFSIYDNYPCDDRNLPKCDLHGSGYMLILECT